MACNRSRDCVFRSAHLSQQRAPARGVASPLAAIPGALVQPAALLLPLMLAAAPAPDAACVAHSTRERPHLVELYTSEGCSSCPPAERWMSSIRDDATQVGLEFHVDYWDELGWPDPFADARYTARQRTPELVSDTKRTISAIGASGPSRHDSKTSC